MTGENHGLFYKFSRVFLSLLNALFTIWRYSFFSGGLTASPAPLQPGMTRCDVTLVRESQRWIVSDWFSAKDLIAHSGVPPAFFFGRSN